MGDTIIGVQFGIANPDEIVARSVVEVITDKTYQSNQPYPGGVFDARFGVIENGKVCPTCKQTNVGCPGHFGHIKLARPVYLYQFLDSIQKILQVACLNCSNPYLPDEILDSLSPNLTGISRFDEVRDKTSTFNNKQHTCLQCGSNSVRKVHKIENTVASLEARFYAEGETEPPPVALQPEMVLRCFQRISDAHVNKLGFNAKFSRPDWMVCTVLAVPPLTVRPSVVMEDNQRMEDDLTHKLISIVRINQRLRDKIDKGDNADIIDECTKLLQYDVATYVDNDIKGLPPAAQRSGRPLKTLKSRLGAKTGRVRGNLMGKRVDFSARSVITPDANIELDELGVPEEIAMNLTFPEIVTIYNRDRLLAYIRNGPAKYPGAKSVFLKDEDKSISLRYVNPETIDIKEGDVVHRHLIDNDVVLFNRQPSLHKASMECHRIKALPYSTFRLNVSATKPYNADFDGDEMNMHVPQSIVAATELKALASVLRQIISPRTHTPIIQIVQDTMTGVFRISKPDAKVPEHIAMNILGRMKRPLSSYTRKDGMITGQELISTAFPLMDFEGRISVEQGQLVKGLLKKGAFNGSIDDAAEGMLSVIYNDYTPQRCGQFVNDIQSIVTKYNLYTGFSVGASDLIASRDVYEQIDVSIAEARQKISDLISSVHAGQFLNDSAREDGEELEIQILDVLRKTSSTIAESVMNSLPKKNRMIEMVDSGAKGSNLNIAQMVALLGQQFIVGKRVQNTLQDRSLPHFTKYNHGLEAHGFVENSFISGLRPAEFFFHAMAGREGLIDTAVKTSDSGYIQRRLVKTMEDLHVEYDGTVRNATGSIVQFQYGGDGIESTAVESQACDLGTMTMEQVYKEFAASKNDYHAVCSKPEEVEEDDFVERILADREFLIKNVWRYKRDSKLFAPVNIRRILKKYKNPYATKTDLTPGYVMQQLDAMCAESWMRENKAFHCLLRYYLAPKKVILVARLSRALFDELVSEIRYKYIKARVHPGEMVGTLAAQSIGEPTTQLTLNTFHSTGTVKANATQGVPRLMELLAATPNPKNPSNVVFARADVATSQDTMFSMMKEIQKTTLRDITRSVRIYYDPNPTSESTAIKEDAEILKAYELFSVTQGATCSSPWILRLELDRTEMARRNVMDMTSIQARIQDNKVLKVFDCIPNDTNSPDKLVLRIVFQPDTVKNALALRFIEEKLLDTVLTGIDGIGRVYLREIKDEMTYDPVTGGFAPLKQYVLDAEGTNILDLAVYPNVDPFRTFSNDIHEILDVFGIEAVRQCLYDEFMEVFTAEYVNYHHMITLIDTMTYPGFILSVNRFGMNKGESGVLAQSSFEETSKILFNAAISGDFDAMKGVSGNIMFGQKPPCGTGFVDILIDETKLPEGAEEPPDMSGAEIDAVNTKLAKPDEKECRIEDIAMEW
jgi:DNA-directed RNA polymerase II subunit RPB1